MKLEVTFLLIMCVSFTKQNHNILLKFNEKLSMLSEQMGYNNLTGMYQDAITKNVSAKTVPIKGEMLLDELSHAVEIKFNNTKEALLKLRDAIESYFKHPEEIKTNSQPFKSKFRNCCDVPKDVNDLNGRLQTIPQDACILIPSYTNTKDAHNIFSYNVSKTMKKNMEVNKDLKWQYFTLADGTMFLYPARQLDHCSTFDPRNRSWFVEAATVHPKDVIIVLDISGSMEMTNVKGKSLLKIVKTGAKMVVNTLNSNDKIGIVAFSDDIKIPNNYGCFQKQLAVATPQNKMAINSFINKLKGKGLTNYVAGLRKAFDYFRNTNSTSNERDRILLFLSDGMPTVGGGREEILDLIQNETAYFNNTIIIMTFGIGKAIQDKDNRQLLIDMANYTKETNHHGHPLGRFQEVTCSDIMRSSMADYYIGLHTYQERQEPITTLPYYDAGRLHYVMSQCLPIQANKTFIGVTCIDIKLNDLLDDIINFKHGEFSYAFIINNNDLAVVHPLLPTPLSFNDDVGVVDIKSLERDTAVRQIIKSMTENNNGSKPLITQRTISRGNGKRDGISVLWIQSTYVWKHIRGSNFSVCIVYNSNENRLILQDQIIPTFLYHNFHQQNFTKTRICKIGNTSRIITKNKSVVKFAPNTFQNSLEYKNGNETTKNISDIVKYMKGEENLTSLFQEGIRASVAFTEPIEDFWMKSDAKDNKTSFIWRYIATLNGILRIYPGVLLNKLYDARHRPWFQRTLNNKGKIVISRPYKDYWGAGIIITISRSICKQNCTLFTDDSPALAVIAGDVRVDYFHELLVTSIPDCKKGNSCIIVDNSGYIILHDDLIYPHNGKNPTCDALHLTVKEPGITETLLNNGIMHVRSCIDVLKMENKYFWELSFSHQPFLKTSEFEIYEIENTNAFIIIKKNNSPEATYHSSASCDQVKNFINREIPQAQENSISCIRIPENGEAAECSCTSNTVFNYCENTFDMTKLSDLWPTCIPETPQPDMSNQDDSFDDDYDQCSSVNCNVLNRSECLRGINCQWCEIYQNGSLLQNPYCAERERCLFRQVNDFTDSGNAKQYSADSNQSTIIAVSVVVCLAFIVVFFCGIFFWKRQKAMKKKDDKSKLLGNQVRVSLVELGKDNASMLWGNFNEGNSIVSVIPEGIPLEKITHRSQISSSSDSIHFLAQKVEALVHRLENQESTQSATKLNGTATENKMPYGYNFPSNRSSSVLPSSYHSSLPRTISCSSVLSSPKSSSLPSSNGYQIATRTPSSDSAFHLQSQLNDEQVVILRKHPGRKGKFFPRAPSERSWPGEYAYPIFIPISNNREPSERTCPQSGVSQWSREREPSESSYHVDDNDWSDIPEENAEISSANDNNMLPRSRSSSFRQRLNSKNSSRRRNNRNTRSRSLSSQANSESIRSFIRQCIETVAAEEENARQRGTETTSASVPTANNQDASLASNGESNYAESNVLPSSSLSFTIEKEKTN